MKTQHTVRNLKSYVCIVMIICLSGIASLSLAGGAWTKKADMPTFRYAFSAATVNGKIYVIGGWGKNGALKTVEEYDPATDTWAQKADMPTARKNLSLSVVDGKIYAIGGYNVVAIGCGGPVFSAVEEYDPATDKWTKKADMPTARVGAVTGMVNGRIYAVGGYGIGCFLPVVEEYDPVADKWRKRANMPFAVGHGGGEAANGKIYVMGGWFFEPVQEYNPVTDTWTVKGHMQTPRRGFRAVALDGLIYAMGGDGPRATVEVYDPVTDRWAKATDMPVAKAWPAASVANGKIYVIGGVTGRPWGAGIGQVFQTVWEYTPEGWTPFAVSPQDKLATMWGEIKRGRPVD